VADIWGFAETMEKPIGFIRRKPPNINHCGSER
jgi:hypothetical protein